MAHFFVADQLFDESAWICDNAMVCRAVPADLGGFGINLDDGCFRVDLASVAGAEVPVDPECEYAIGTGKGL